MQTIEKINVLELLEADLRAELEGIIGFERGFNQADGVIRETLNGVPLNNLWREFNRTLAIWNSQRDPLTNLLTFRVNSENPTEKVFYPTQDVDFEEASEFGEPKGIRAGKPLVHGYDWKLYDLAVRYTFLFLAESTDEQVRALNNVALEASQRLTFSRVMRRVFNNVTNTALINDYNVNVYPFYNADGIFTPPRYKTTTFLNTHTHYLTSGAATVDAGDLEAMADHLTHHGYSPLNGYRFVLLVNPAQANVIRTFAKGVAGASFDFIPGPNSGGAIVLPWDPNRIINMVSTPALGALGDQVIGWYGPWAVVSEEYIPAGYMLGLVSGGSDNIGNPVGIREHQNPALRGARLVKGKDNDYPLTDSFYIHGLGTGVRHRGGGVVMQVTTSGTYTIPAEYA